MIPKWLEKKNIAISLLILGLGIALSIISFNIKKPTNEIIILREKINQELRNAETLASLKNIDRDTFEAMTNYFRKDTNNIYSYVPKIYNDERIDFETNQSAYWNPIIGRNVEINTKFADFYYPMTFLNPVIDRNILFDLYPENKFNTQKTDISPYKEHNIIIVSPIQNENFISIIINVNELLKNAFKDISYTNTIVALVFNEQVLGAIDLNNNEILNELNETNNFQSTYSIGQLIIKTDNLVNPLEYITTILIMFVFLIIAMFYILLIYTSYKKHEDTKIQLRTSYHKWMGYICHSIRGPIHTINYLTETLLENEGPVDYNRLQMLQANTNHLFDLVNTYIDFATLDKRDLTIVNKSVDICHIAESVFHEFTIMASSQVKMSKNISSELIGVHLYLDSLRFRQILSNAINNAVKFTSKGHITMDIVSINQEKIQFIIKDTGPGLNGHDEDKLFEDYQQGEFPARSREKNTASSGLGLSMCLYLAKAMKGTVSLKNRTDNCRGTEFTLTLPYIPVDPSDASSDKSSIIPEKPKMFSELIVCACEDDFSNRQVLREMLLSFGIERDSAIIFADGEELLDYIKDGQKTPHIILLDIFMKRLNGDDLQVELRNMGYNRPIVAITGNAYNKEDYINMGFNKVLIKPFRKKRLKEIIERLILF